MLPISVIIPCFNAEATLARTLDSCLLQPEAAQILVVDDGSRDASPAIAAEYARRHPRIDLMHTPRNGGAAHARNLAASVARHDTLAFIDADDEYLPDALSAATDFLIRNPRQPSIRLDVEYVDFPAEIVVHPGFRDIAETLSNTVPSSLVIRRSLYRALGGFPEDEVFRQHGGEDGALACALVTMFGNPRLTDRKRVRMHYHANIHAERFFRISMGMQAACSDALVATRLASFDFAHRAHATFVELSQFDYSPKGIEAA